MGDADRERAHFGIHLLDGSSRSLVVERMMPVACPGYLGPLDRIRARGFSHARNGLRSGRLGGFRRSLRGLIGRLGLRPLTGSRGRCQLAQRRRMA